MPYLLKTEPSEYSFADLQRDKETIWDGVSNPVALKNLRAMKPGDPNPFMIGHDKYMRFAAAHQLCIRAQVAQALADKKATQ